MSGARAALGCALALGVASTLGDWAWAAFELRGPVPGVIHGALIFAILALALACAAGGTRVALLRLLLALPLAGLAIAASFYGIYPWAGYLGALLICWTAMWLALALGLRWAREGRRATRCGCCCGAGPSPPASARC